MKSNISFIEIKLSSSCINFSRKFLILSNKPNKIPNFQKTKNLLMRKKPVILLKSLEKLIHKNFINTYCNDKDFYNIKVINDIIIN